MSDAERRTPNRYPLDALAPNHQNGPHATSLAPELKAFDANVMCLFFYDFEIRLKDLITWSFSKS